MLNSISGICGKKKKTANKTRNAQHVSVRAHMLTARPLLQQQMQ